MSIYQNESGIDRAIRVLLAEVAVLGGMFWLGGVWHTVAYVVGVVLLITAITGFCGLYKVFGFSTRSAPYRPMARWQKVAFVVLAVTIAVVGGYYSIFFTKKFFLDDYNRMNNYYKQTLFFTGQDKRADAVSNYNLLLTEYAVFYSKYSQYRPYVFASDAQFVTDLANVNQIIGGLNQMITTGDLKSAHLELETVRPVFQELLKRNGFSMLAVYLVDFHDAMEKIIASADANDVSGVEDAYGDADAKLKAVEELANDEEIQAIRQKLDEVLGLAKTDQADKMSAKAAELKSAFVRVYLKRG